MIARRIPHPTREIFKNHNILIGDVALTLGVSYPYLSTVLTGLQRPSADIDRKLWDLAREVEGEAKATCATDSSPVSEGGIR